VTRSPMVRRVMGASCIHGRVGAFYAPRAREGKQIVPMQSFASVESISGHPRGPRRAPAAEVPPWQDRESALQAGWQVSLPRRPSEGATSPPLGALAWEPSPHAHPCTRAPAPTAPVAVNPPGAPSRGPRCDPRHTPFFGRGGGLNPHAGPTGPRPP
jgi:hypothetical protein